MSASKYRAPRGNELSCANWQIEAAYRMIQNNLDAEVAEDPERLVVYGGSGKAARNVEALQGILATLRRLKPDEHYTLTCRRHRRITSCNLLVACRQRERDT